MRESDKKKERKQSKEEVNIIFDLQNNKDSSAMDDNNELVYCFSSLNTKSKIKK